MRRPPLEVKPTPTAPFGRMKPRQPNDKIVQAGRTMQERVDHALRQLERALGGRDAIASALHCAEDLTPDETRVANLLADPSHARKPIRQVLQAADPTLTIGRLLKIFAKGKGAEAYALSLAKIYDGAPKTAAYLMETSVPHKGNCPECYGRAKRIVKELACEHPPDAPPCEKCAGSGKILIEGPCRRCEGTGRVEKEPETERIKLALQAAGIVKDAGVRVSNTTVNASIEATLVQTSAAFRSATDKILWQQPEQVQDAEVVKRNDAVSDASEG